VWGIPSALLAHNLEEGLTFARYAPRVRALAPAGVASLIPDVATMYLALVVLTLASFVLAALTRSRQWATYGLLLVAAVLFVNVAWHVVAALWLGGYAPGLITALVVNLPATVAALRWGSIGGWLSGRRLWMLMLAALLLHGPGLIAIFTLVTLV